MCSPLGRQIHPKPYLSNQRPLLGVPGTSKENILPSWVATHATTKLVNRQITTPLPSRERGPTRRAIVTVKASRHTGTTHPALFSCQASSQLPKLKSSKHEEKPHEPRPPTPIPSRLSRPAPHNTALTLQLPQVVSINHPLSGGQTLGNTYALPGFQGLATSQVEVLLLR